MPVGLVDASLAVLHSYYRQPGQAYGLGIAIGHMVRCTKRTYYDDRPEMRLRRNIIIYGPRGSCKALAVNTPIPTPSGWKTMGELAVGDLVFDENGMPCRIVNATEVMLDRPCFNVQFGDGSSIVADADHLWLTQTKEDRHHRIKRNGKRVKMPSRVGSVKTTAEIGESLLVGGRSGWSEYNHSVVAAKPLVMPHAKLPIDPYVLGAWLGDGTSATSGITLGDVEIAEEIRNAGHPIKKAAAKYGWSISHGRRGPKAWSFAGELRSLGVLGNKHIPDQYLLSSKEQRLALLRGLMDTDGCCHNGGHAVFYNTSEAMAKQVYRLVASLGFIPHFWTRRPTINGRPEAICKKAYAVGFIPGNVPAFRLARKLAKQSAKTYAGKRRSIVAVEPTPSVPVRCIEVDSTSRLYLAGDGCIPTHNSSISKYALFKVFGCVDVLDPVHAVQVSDRTMPTVCTLGSGSGFERARGTFSSEGGLMSPLFQESTWIYAPELMTVLGHNPNDRAKRIDEFNGIVEEGSVRILLAKGGNADMAKRKEIAESIPANAGYHYDPQRATISYECTAAFLGCTRELSDKLRAEMDQNGYWSRHSIEEWCPVSSEARAHADKKFGRPPAAADLADLKGRWLDLWNTPIVKVNSPPEVMLDEAVQWYNARLRDIEEECETPFKFLYSGRDDSDIAQILTSAALNRMTRRRPLGMRDPIESIKYEADDLQTAKRWMSGRLAHLRNLHGTDVSEKQADDKDKSLSMLGGFLKMLQDKGEPDVEQFTSKDLVAYYVKRGGGASTARRHLGNLRKAGLVSPVRDAHGDYTVDHSVLERLGIEVPDVASAIEHEEEAPPMAEEDEGAEEAQLEM